MIPRKFLILTGCVTAAEVMTGNCSVTMLIVLIKNCLRICLLLLTKLMAVANKSNDNTKERSVKTENKQSSYKDLVVYSCVLILMRESDCWWENRRLQGILKKTAIFK